jgi:hypothetical protein
MKVCAESDCNRKMHAKNLCHVHYIKDKQKNSPLCSNPDCKKPSRSRGMCTSHYEKQLRMQSQEEINYDDFWEFVKKQLKIGEPNGRKI